jgi:hypothetical protein
MVTIERTGASKPANGRTVIEIGKDRVIVDAGVETAALSRCSPFSSDDNSEHTPDLVRVAANAGDTRPTPNKNRGLVVRLVDGPIIATTAGCRAEFASLRDPTQRPS